MSEPLTDLEKDALHSLSISHPRPCNFGPRFFDSIIGLRDRGIVDQVTIKGDRSIQCYATAKGREISSLAENEPAWLRDMSPRERSTRSEPWNRTVSDYLTILHERPGAHFGEHDNTTVIFQMIKDGLLEWRKDQQSVFTSMNTSLWPRLTDAGRSALADEGER